MLQLRVQNRFQDVQLDVSIVVLAVDEQRRRAHDANVGAIVQVLRNGLADLRRIEIGFEALHIQADSRCQG